MTARRFCRASFPAIAAAAVLAHPASADLILFSDPSGLSAQAEFTLVNPTTLQIRLRNTSTGAPAGFEASDQILTTLSWDFGPAGPAGPAIIGGSVVIGPTSSSINFDTGFYGPGFDVSGEWGFANNGGTGAIMNFISATAAQTTAFGGVNLDGPVGLDGPQGGLVASPAVLPLGGQGAISNEIIATLLLGAPVANLNFLYENLVRVEFGSDAFFITVPAPAALPVLAAATLLGCRRRRGRHAH